MFLICVAGGGTGSYGSSVEAHKLELTKAWPGLWLGSMSVPNPTRYHLTDMGPPKGIWELHWMGEDSEKSVGDV